MPGYVIHLSVAEEYLKKHKNVKEDYNQFIAGVIFPDGVEDKSLTHYGEKSSKSNLATFLKENKLDNSFKRGYFLHLVTDYLFYNKYIDTMSNDIYNDYDLLNDMLIKKYNVVLPEKIKDRVFFKDVGDLKILSLPLVEKLISEISNLNLYDLEKEIQNNPDKWTKFRELKRI